MAKTHAEEPWTVRQQATYRVKLMRVSVQCVHVLLHPTPSESICVFVFRRSMQ